jgi:hypothetical protein
LASVGSEEHVLIQAVYLEAARDDNQLEKDDLCMMSAAAAFA